MDLGNAARPAVPPSASAAKKLLIAALAFQGAFVFGPLLVEALAPPATFGSPTEKFLAPILALPESVLWVLVYTLTYRRARKGDYRRARGPTLVWAVVSFVLLDVVSGILYLLAYGKLGDSVAELVGVPPSGTIPYTVPPSPVGEAAQAGVGAGPRSGTRLRIKDRLTCPRCGNPTVQVMGRSRRYCYACSRYVR